jgi:ribosomal protein S18 acetylase RimI-like enzyme
MIVRPRTEADEAALVACELITERYHAAAAPGRFCEQAPPVVLAPPFKNDEQGETFIAEVDGEIAGFVDVRVQNNPAHVFFRARRVAFVAQLVVKDEHRKRGVGRALMETAAAWARERDCTEITLNVFEFNEPAQRLYRSLGYETVSRWMEFKL